MATLKYELDLSGISDQNYDEVDLDMEILEDLNELETIMGEIPLIGLVNSAFKYNSC